jgi:hypothetical protein
VTRARRIESVGLKILADVAIWHIKMGIRKAPEKDSRRAMQLMVHWW